MCSWHSVFVLPRSCQIEVPLTVMHLLVGSVVLYAEKKFPTQRHAEAYVVPQMWAESAAVMIRVKLAV